MSSASLPRIAYLTGQYPEVSLTFILREVEALRRLGAEVTTCSIRRTPPEQHPGPAEKQAAAETFHVLEQAKNPLRLLSAQGLLFTRPRRYLRALHLAWKTCPPGMKAAVYQLIFFIEATLLARHLEREKIDHLHNHFVFGAATVAMLQSELTGIPYSFTLHGPADLFDPYRWHIDEKVARAKFVSTISNYARSQVMFFSDPSHWDKVRIIHCGVNPALYAGDPTPPVPDAFRLLFVGRLAPVKGLRVLFEAIEMLADDIPGMKVDLVGDGPDRAQLEADAAPIGNRLHFLGYKSQDEVAALMKSHDAFVLPSFAEGVPVVLMEALASGIPVIATQVAGVGELVEQQASGLLVAPGDAESLARAIRQLANAPEDRARMGRHGRDIVGRDYNIDMEAARLLRLFAEGPGPSLRPAPYKAPLADGSPQ